MFLSNVENGKWLKIVGFESDGGLEHKLRQLGLEPGDYTRVIRQAPLGGPILVEIEGREIALGRKIASKILVEDIDCVLR